MACVCKECEGKIKNGTGAVTAIKNEVLGYKNEVIES